MKRLIPWTALAAGAFLLCGCQQYLSRQDFIEPYAGNAVAQNRALQMQDPWPRYAYDTAIPTNGRRQAAAYTRMAKSGEEAPPQELAPIQLVVPQPN